MSRATRLLLAAGLVLAVVLGAVALTAGLGPGQPPGPARPPQSPAEGGDQDPAAPPTGPRPSPGGGAVPAGDRVRCPAATVTVSSAAQLEAALAAARPGAVIALADGSYDGAFVARASGTATQPIWLCGSRAAVLQGRGVEDGYALHLDRAAHWRLVGFSVRNAQKGVMADGTTGTRIQDLLIEQIGDEALHLRAGSSRNVVLDNTIRRTGLRRAEFGEGIYVGSAQSNWETYGDGGPDRSDANRVQGNDISQTTAEAVDIKEGTTGGLLLDNTFDGAGTTAADSWVDVKGNDWTVQGNTGRNAVKDGFQTHRILDGAGDANTFRANVALDSGSGVDVYVHKPKLTRNTVLCDNRGPGDRPATSNVPCSAAPAAPAGPS